METVKQLLPIIMHVSLILVVLAVGLQSRWADFTYALSHPGLLLRGIVAVNLAVPAAAAILIALFPMSTGIKVGILMMAVAPLAPLVPGKMLKAGSACSYAIGLYVALMLLAVLIVPLTLVILSRIFPGEAWIPPMAIARLVFVSVLLPLIVGALVGTFAPVFAQRAAGIAQLLGNIGLVIFLVPALIVLGPPMLALVGDGTVVAIVLTVLAGLAAGHLLGGPNPANRTALAFAAATRHPGMAIMMARANYEDRQIVPTVILFLLTGVVVSALYQIWARKHAAAAEAGAAPAAAP